MHWLTLIFLGVVVIVVVVCAAAIAWAGVLRALIERLPPPAPDDSAC